jgi:histidinol phosphatase-like PHP family hydrolase
MAEAAMGNKYDYIAITDHSQSLKITNGLTAISPDALARTSPGILDRL